MDTTVEIIPAIMPDDFEELASDVSLIGNKVEWVQIDVMDGKYTDSVSWPYADPDKHFTEILNEDEGLPNWQNINYELDLMVSDPYKEAEKWVRAGVARIVLHLSTLKNGDTEILIEKLRGLNIEVGIALLPSESFTEIENILSKIDFVQFMGIEKVGFQNQDFAEVVLENISEFHKKYPEKIISVDGAVDTNTSKALVEAGATRLVSGSFIFEAGNPKEQIEILLQSVEN